MSHRKGEIRWENPHIDVVYFRSASVYIITLNRLHYFPWYKIAKIIPCRWRHRTIVNGISQKHGGRIEKGWRNFCKKSPFGFHLEYILKTLVTAYKKKTFENQDLSLWIGISLMKVRKERLNFVFTISRGKCKWTSFKKTLISLLFLIISWDLLNERTKGWYC